MADEGKKYLAKVIHPDKTMHVSICDKELLGTVIKEKGIEIRISKEYFDGVMVNSRDALDLIQSSNVANLAGDSIIHETLRANLASALAVKRMGSVSFLMIFKF